jgi:hypothetical protein
MTYLKVLMHEKAEFCLVGDDDSGPEDLRMIWILSAGACHLLKAKRFLNVPVPFCNKPLAFEGL